MLLRSNESECVNDFVGKKRRRMRTLAEIMLAGMRVVVLALVVLGSQHTVSYPHF